MFTTVKSEFLSQRKGDRHARRIRLTKLGAVSLSLTLGFGFTLAQASSAEAAPRTSAKVTICHRTHAVSNPYRQITVSINSVISNNGHHNSVHNKISAQNPFDDKGTPADPSDDEHVFDPTWTYQPNAKMWQDIIPAFSYDDQGTTKFFAGRNWNAKGKEIYYGTNGKAGLCGKTGAKEFAQAEYNEWLKDNPGANNGDKTSKQQEVINDLKEQAALDENANDFRNFDELPSVPPSPPGPNRPNGFSDLLTRLDNANNGKADTALKQALAGVVWQDMDRDGVQDGDEKIFGGLGIQIINPDTGNPLTPNELAALASTKDSRFKTAGPKFSFATWSGRQLFRTAATTVTLYTDSNGYFEVPSLPAGDWKVVVITPDGWQYTYDSSGSSDGSMPETFVPAGGAGFAWAGLVYTGVTGGGADGGTNGGANGSSNRASGLPATGAGGSWVLLTVGALSAIGAGGYLLHRKRQA